MLDISQIPEFDHRARARLHRPRERNHRRPADRRAAEARHHAQRRAAHGAQRARRPTATSRIRSVVEAFTKYRKTHNEGVFDAYTADIRACRSSHILTGLPDAYGRGRIIGDYRRVALYGVARLIEQKKQEKAALDSGHVHRGHHSRPRRTERTDPRAATNCRRWPTSYGFDISGPARTAREAVQWLYFAYLAAVKEQNGAAMSLGRTSTFLDIYFERDLAAGHADRGAGAGNHRRLRHQAAHRPLPAHARIRRAVRRRSDLGDRVDRRHGRRRPVAGDQDQLPLPADALQPRPGAGAEPHDLVFAAAAGRLPEVRGEGRHRHQLAAVRERRDHAPRLGRRRRDRLLRFADAGRQADAVLRRARQPGQVPALRHQRRPRRDHRQADRPGRPSRSQGDYLDFDDVVERVRADDGLAGGRVRERDERHPLHARQVRVRAASRWRCTTTRRCGRWRSASPGLSVVADSLSAIKLRQGEGDSRRDGAGHRLPDRRRLPEVRQQRQPRGSDRAAGVVSACS